MNLSVGLGNLLLKNPVIVASGPWSGSIDGIRKCIDSGAGAVVTETITMDANPNLHPYIHRNGPQFFSIKLNSNLYLEQWESLLPEIDKRDSKLICSIRGTTVSEVRYLAKRMERIGADAIELSLSAPIGARSLLTFPEQMASIVEATVEAVCLPVLVKLPYESGFFPEMLQMLYDSGARIVTAIDALRGLNGVDVERRQTWMPTYGGYSSESIRPVSLATTAMLKQYTPFDICSCGGISDYLHAIEFIMLGAGAVELGSAIHIGGYSVISKMVSGLETWMNEHSCGDLAEIRGAALPSLRPFEDITPRPVKAIVNGSCNKDCGICADGCIYQAIKAGCDGISVDQSQCTGCGYCIASCPDKKLMWNWF